MSEAAVKRSVALRACLTALVFVAPFRLSSLIGGGEEAHFPSSLIEWLFLYWPSFLLGPLSGLALLWVTIRCRGRDPSRWRASIPVVWAVLGATAVLGVWSAAGRDFALIFFLYLWGVVALVLAVWRLDGHDPALRRWLLNAVALAALFSCLFGWRQHFGGLAASETEIRQQMEARGQVLGGGMMGKLAQRRVYGPFVGNPNSYGAFLALVGPLMIALLWRWGGRFEPRKMSRALLAGVGCVLWVGALWWSRSRGAMLGVCAGLGVGALSMPGLRRWRWPLCGGGVVLGGVVVFAASMGRGLATVGTRASYYMGALRMFAEAPVAGVGFGGFFHNYMRLKWIGEETTRVPHNMVLNFLSQAGLLAGLAAVCCLAMPVAVALFAAEKDREEDRWLFAALTAGATAWSVHALLDFNIMIPATVSLAAMFPLFCLRAERMAEDAESATFDRMRIFQVVVVVLALAALWRVPGEMRFQKTTNLAQRGTITALERSVRDTSRWLPACPYPWRLLASVAERKGDLSTADRAYAEALARSPERASFSRHAAEVRLKLRDVEGADKLLKHSLHWQPSSARVLTLAVLARHLISHPELSPDAYDELVAVGLLLQASVSESGDEVVVTVSLPSDSGVPKDAALRFVAALGSVSAVYPPDGRPLAFRLGDSGAR
ncbi:MAG: O-antigen ligase family protein [Lentisphaeria bacterium]|nr:O-antigen ligase family protein [Lentisphaeria bacterium]